MIRALWQDAGPATPLAEIIGKVTPGTIPGLAERLAGNGARLPVRRGGCRARRSASPRRATAPYLMRGPGSFRTCRRSLHAEAVVMVMVMADDPTSGIRGDAVCACLASEDGGLVTRAGDCHGGGITI